MKAPLRADRLDQAHGQDDSQLDNYKQEVAQLHKAFLRGDTKFFDKCEKRFPLPSIS